MTHKGKKPIKRKRGRPSSQSYGKLLSDREEEVLNHLKDGKQYRKIGELLFISTETVRRHAATIYKKLKVRNRIQATLKFFALNGKDKK